MPSAEKAETTFYSDDRGIRITNRSLTFGNTTYSMATLSALAVKRERTYYEILVIVILCLLVWLTGFLGGGTKLSIIGGFGTIIFLAAFVISAVLRKWNLTITSSSGESSPIRSRNKEYVESIAQAIQEARETATPRSA